MRYTIILLFPLLFTSCTQKSYKADLNKKENLKQQLSQIDTLVSQSKLKSQGIIVTRNGDRRLISGETETANTKLDTTFTIWQNKQGTIKRADVYPYSISGDWTAAFIHYFDEQGRTFAFYQSISFFGSYCKDVSVSDFIINEDIRWYYDSTFTQVDSTYVMTSAGDQSINPDSCVNPYQYFEFSPSANVTDYLKRIQYKSVKKN